MAARISFLMALHCHQPVGNFDFVFEKAFRSAYEPFLTVLERHPTIQVALHYSGSLLDWLHEQQPDFLVRLRRLAQQGQVELLTSGYYEPILPVIPEEDRQGQVMLMQRAMHKWIGVTPQGLWLTERVWEPEVPHTLARAGIRYTLLDGNQFRAVEGVLPRALQIQDDQGWDLLGAYVTEYAGESVVVFPTSKRLRYWIPFHEVSQTIGFLKRLARETPVAITYADDGEKFGLWPKTSSWVYDQGWLEQFFTALEQESSWLKTSTCSRYLDEVGPSGQVYLPCGSYEEMLEWSGGYFRNFFVKYPEANAMRQRMLGVSRAVRDAHHATVNPRRSRRPRSDIRHSSLLLTRAQQELYQAQCNDAYWHGVFGGLYLAHLRRAVYRHLITAERLVQQARGSRPSRELRDVDGDGRPEVVLRNQALSVVVDPTEDGTVTELDCSPGALNLTDTVMRRYEPYHETLKRKQPAPVGTMRSHGPATIHDLLHAKEEGLEAYLAYDDHRRSCFIDYALSTMPTLQEVWRSTWGEHRLWSAGPWDLQGNTPRGARSDRTTVAMHRRVQGRLLQKSLTLWRKQPRLLFRYDVRDLAIPVVGLEWNVCLRDDRWTEPRWHASLREFEVRDSSLGVTIAMTIDPPASLVTFPIETVSESEEGLERTPQGLAIVCLWPTQNQPRWSCGLEWAVEAR